MRKVTRATRQKLDVGPLQIVIAIRNGQGEVPEGGDETKIRGYPKGEDKHTTGTPPVAPGSPVSLIELPLRTKETGV